MPKWMDTLELIKGPYYEVETQNSGTCIVPEEVCGRAPGVSAKRRREQLPDEICWDEKDDVDAFERVRSHVMDYVIGRRIYQITRKHGVCWRLTEPGYLDSTDWSAAASEEEAKRDAEELYDHKEEE